MAGGVANLALTPGQRGKVRSSRRIRFGRGVGKEDGRQRFVAGVLRVTRPGARRRLLSAEYGRWDPTGPRSVSVSPAGATGASGTRSTSAWPMTRTTSISSLTALSCVCIPTLPAPPKKGRTGRPAPGSIAAGSARRRAYGGRPGQPLCFIPTGGQQDDIARAEARRCCRAARGVCDCGRRARVMMPCAPVRRAVGSEGRPAGAALAAGAVRAGCRRPGLPVGRSGGGRRSGSRW